MTVFQNKIAHPCDDGFRQLNPRIFKASETELCAWQLWWSVSPHRQGWPVVSHLQTRRLGSKSTLTDKMFQLTLTTPLDLLQPGWSVDVDMQATVPVSGSTWIGRERQYWGSSTVFQYSSTPEHSCDNSSPCWKRIEASWFPNSKPHYSPPRPLWSVVLCYKDWEIIATCIRPLPVIPRESEFAQIILNIEEFFCSDVREAAIHFILVHALQQGIQYQRAHT